MDQAMCLQRIHMFPLNDVSVRETTPFILATDLLFMCDGSPAQPGGEAYERDVLCQHNASESIDRDITRPL